MYLVIFLIFLVFFVFLLCIFKAIFYCINKNKLEYSDIKDPWILPEIIPNILYQEDCKNIINHVKNKLNDSEILSGKNESIRKSQQTWIKKNDTIAEPIYKFISNKYNIPIENAEDLQIVRYLPGNYYNEHHDSCCDNHQNCYDFIKRGGQRILTVLIYLNNEFTDGETFFPKLNKKYKPKTGDGIVFYPVAQNTNKCHPLALHAGLPVTSGEKYVCNLWFRENKFV